MSDEQAVQSELIAKFPFLQDKVRVSRPRRLWVDTPADQFAAVFDYVTQQAGFNMLCTITGLDEGQTLGAIYHLARPQGMMLNLHVSVPKDNPVLQSVMNRYPVAECYERELIDLLGMQVQGLPPGNRYPLTDDWPKGQYPLRKEWKAEMLNAPAPQQGEVKNG